MCKSSIDHFRASHIWVPKRIRHKSSTFTYVYHRLPVCMGTYGPSKFSFFVDTLSVFATYKSGWYTSVWAAKTWSNWGRTSQKKGLNQRQLFHYTDWLRMDSPIYIYTYVYIYTYTLHMYIYIYIIISYHIHTLD